MVLELPGDDFGVFVVEGDGVNADEEGVWGKVVGGWGGGRGEGEVGDAFEVRGPGVCFCGERHGG